MEKAAPSRSFSIAKLNNFKAALGGSDWSVVTNSLNVDDAFNEFWSIYTDLYELSFPKIKTRFNRNVHKQCPFMSNGLLISRQTKNQLYKAKICVNSPENAEKYRKYKTVYFKCLRAAKKLYFTKKLQTNAKNSKKTWQALNEVLGKEQSQPVIDKTSGFWPRVRARALRAPVFLSSLPPQTGRCAPPLPVHRSYEI